MNNEFFFDKYFLWLIDYKGPPNMQINTNHLVVQNCNSEESEGELQEEESRICEWSGCDQIFTGLESLVNHVNTTHVHVRI